MMWGGMFAGLVLVGLLVVLFAALLFAGLAWLLRQGRQCVEMKAQAVPVEESRSLTHR